jgi:hypothetical protein
LPEGRKALTKDGQAGGEAPTPGATASGSIAVAPVILDDSRMFQPNEKDRPMQILTMLPLFGVWLILYNVAMFTPGVDMNVLMDSALFQLPLPSGESWSAGVSDIVLLLGIATLYIELFKATRTGSSTVFEHTLSMGVLLIFLVEFLVVGECANSTFLLLAMMSLLDVVAGFTITIATARRDFGVGQHGFGGHE